MSLGRYHILVTIPNRIKEGLLQREPFLFHANSDWPLIDNGNMSSFFFTSLFHANSGRVLINRMEQWESILTKFLKEFFLDYEEDTAKDYIGVNQVTSNQTKCKEGGYCSVTGRPNVYGQSFTFEDALKTFKAALTKEEAQSITITTNTEDRVDAEEHDEEQTCTEITISKIT